MADLTQFDPNSVGLLSNNVFGLPFSEEDAKLVLLPVPWEVTVSYSNGTARGPEQIFKASFQVDLLDPDVKDGWKKGFFMRDAQCTKDLLARIAFRLIKLARTTAVRDRLRQGGAMHIVTFYTAIIHMLA